MVKHGDGSITEWDGRAKNLVVVYEKLNGAKCMAIPEENLSEAPKDMRQQL